MRSFLSKTIVSLILVPFLLSSCGKQLGSDTTEVDGKRIAKYLEDYHGGISEPKNNRSFDGDNTNDFYFIARDNTIWVHYATDCSTFNWYKVDITDLLQP